MSGAIKTRTNVRLAEISGRSTSLSPKMYRSIAKPLCPTVELRDLLDKDQPYARGTEPGRDAYVDSGSSLLVRNSALQAVQVLPAVTGAGVVKILHTEGETLTDGDIVLSKDSNVGAAAYIPSGLAGALFSGGLVRLNPTVDKFYLLAWIRNEYFQAQLDAKVPTGATIRHAGTRFLEVYVPDPSQVAEASLISHLMASMVQCEVEIRDRHRMMIEDIDSELFISIASKKPIGRPTFSKFGRTSWRFDFGLHSDRVQQFRATCETYGLTSLAEMGVVSRRGPNLAESVIGQVIYSDESHPGWYRLIRPKSVTNYGTLSSPEFLGTKQSLPLVKKGEIVFGTEATLRSHVVCEEIEKCTTNFHGTILSWPGADLADVVALRCLLEYQRQAGIFSDLAVGGQGGHLSPEYFDTIAMPAFDGNVRARIAKHYFNEDLGNPGIWQLEKRRSTLSDTLNLLLTRILSGQ